MRRTPFWLIAKGCAEEEIQLKALPLTSDGIGMMLQIAKDGLQEVLESTDSEDPDWYWLPRERQDIDVTELGFRTRVMIKDYPDIIIKGYKKEYWSQHDWILAEFESKEARLGVHLLPGGTTLNEVKKTIAERSRTISRMYSHFEEGTTSMAAVKKNGDRLEGSVVFSNRHVDLVAIKVKDVMEGQDGKQG
jgi:hypothetical protein